MHFPATFLVAPVSVLFPLFVHSCLREKFPRAAFSGAGSCLRAFLGGVGKLWDMGGNGIVPGCGQVFLSHPRFSLMGKIW